MAISEAREERDHGRICGRFVVDDGFLWFGDGRQHRVCAARGSWGAFTLPTGFKVEMMPKPPARLLTEMVTVLTEVPKGVPFWTTTKEDVTAERVGELIAASSYGGQPMFVYRGGDGMFWVTRVRAFGSESVPVKRVVGEMYKTTGEYASLYFMFEED